MRKAYLHSLFLCAALLLELASLPAPAQITPDTTLPNNSIVLPNGNVLTIEGGTETGSNLFHSFQDFSIPTGGEAFFNNAITIENIITRVTGGNLSDIDGILRANGAANLFLINPNGIQFGPNARLEIGGSFLGSTAESLLFEDGSFYSAKDANAPPLLSVNVPVGLQMGISPGAIEVRGSRQNLMESSSLGLQVRPGQTLALVGGDLNLDGTILTAEGGRIELGSVFADRVSVQLNPTTGFTLAYNNVQHFQDIQFSQQALADVSSAVSMAEIDGSLTPVPINSSGSISIQGANVSLSDGSVLLGRNLGLEPGGSIEVNASESLNLRGTSPDGETRTRIGNETAGLGQGGTIQIVTPQLTLQEGAILEARTLSAGNAGDITIDGSESVRILGFSPINPADNSVITSQTFGLGASGNITLSTGELVLRDGGLLVSASFGGGNTGTLRVTADSILLAGTAPSFSVSNISASTTSDGDAGSVIVNTRQLRLQEGGRISTATLAGGSAGSLVVNASESIEISGTVPDSINPSQIDSSANIVDDILQELFNLPPFPTGNAGDVTINTPQLRVSDGARVTVRHDGLGNAGNLQVNANSISLNARGSISASTQLGEGGNIVLNVPDLQLRNGSNLSAEAGGIGDGGNVTIDSDTINLLENSRINANAFEGAGGNIEITTRGLFVSPDSRITASSQFGIDGVVSVNNPIVDPASGLVVLDADSLNPNTQVQNPCEIATRSRFSITGNGGLPPDPTQPFLGQTVWRDTRLGEIPTQLTPNLPETEPEAISVPTVPLVEVTGWRWNDRGQIELVAVPGNPSYSSWQPHPDCEASSVHGEFRPIAEDLGLSE